MTMLTHSRRTPNSAASKIQCPLCSFHHPHASKVEQHINIEHPEPTPASSSRSRPYALTSNETRKKERSRTASPASGSGDDEDENYPICEVEGCGEPILRSDMQAHMDLHYAEMVAMEQYEGRSLEVKKEKKERKEGLGSGRKHKSERERHGDKGERDSKKRKESRQYGVRRLGKSELGPYADEIQMPSKLRRQLEEGGKVTYRTQISANGTLTKVPVISNETQNLIFTLSQLCSADENVDQAWLCHPGVRHVGKQGKEGGFCGYRNIQMLISYIQAVKLPGQPFGEAEKGVPNILRLQDWIEEGWDEGINANSRIETGGIRGTRKYIGTSEAQTLFTHMGIPNLALPFPSTGPGIQTQLSLLTTVEQYFKSSIPPTTPKAKVYVTPRPPIYYQQRGHSMTIVGIERTKDGWQNLLVFDPVFTPSPAIKSLEGRDVLPRGTKAEVLLKAYRRGLGHLGKFGEFELLVLDVLDGMGINGASVQHGGHSRSGHHHAYGHGQQRHGEPGRTGSGSSSGSASSGGVERASRYY